MLKYLGTRKLEKEIKGRMGYSSKKIQGQDKKVSKYEVVQIDWMEKQKKWKDTYGKERQQYNKNKIKYNDDRKHRSGGKKFN